MGKAKIAGHHSISMMPEPHQHLRCSILAKSNLSAAQELHCAEQAKEAVASSVRPQRWDRDQTNPARVSSNAPHALRPFRCLDMVRMIHISTGRMWGIECRSR